MPGSTVVTVGLPASSSMMEPMPLTPPTANGTVSLASTRLSCVVGTVMVKLARPAGTVMVPSALSVTPSLNTGTPMSALPAVPPPSVKA